MVRNQLPAQVVKYVDRVHRLKESQRILRTKNVEKDNDSTTRAKEIPFMKILVDEIDTVYCWKIKIGWK